MNNPAPVTVVLPPSLLDTLETCLRAEVAYLALADDASEDAHQTAANAYENACRLVAAGLAQLLPGLGLGSLGGALVEKRRQRMVRG
ncbi:hypothetical protein [Pseudomonas sp. RT6P73]